MSTLRTFIAVEPAPAVRKGALELIERLRRTSANVKWVGATELHWTLKFLGDVEMQEIPGVCAAVVSAAHDLPAFSITAFGAGAFPGATRPRTLWLGVRKGTDEFVALHNRIEEALVPLGYRAEQRRFHPHMTLGRVRNGPHGSGELGRFVNQFFGFHAGDMTVSEVVVFSSRLERQGPVYEVLSRAPLS
jgi:2'-5' RNA ligase